MIVESLLYYTILYAKGKEILIRNPDDPEKSGFFDETTNAIDEKIGTKVAPMKTH